MMKHLESFIGQVMASRMLLHLAFCLAFVVSFSFAVVLSGNHDVAGAAMISCLYILACTYIGRWYGKSWLNRLAVPASLSRSVLIFLAMVLGSAAGAAYMFKGDVSQYFLQNLFICLPYRYSLYFWVSQLPLARHTV